MSSTSHRPFTAATDTFAYAQVFTRSTLHSADDTTTSHRDERRRHVSLLHRGERAARRSAAR